MGIAPWQSQLNQTVPGGSQAASFKSASDINTGAGLAHLAQGLDQLGGTILEHQIKERNDLLDMEGLQDIQDFHRRSDEWQNNFMANNQGRLGVNAGEEYRAWAQKEVQALNSKWEGRSKRVLKYMAMHGGGIVNSGYSSMLGFGRQEKNAWMLSTANGGVSLALQDARKDPLNWGNYLDPALDTLGAAMRKSGKSEEEVEAKLRELRSGGQETAALALGEVGEHEAARKILGLQTPTAAAPYMDMVNEAAKTYDLPPELILAVMKTESNFDHKAVSKAGAQGLMQLMPGTAMEMGVEDSFDPRQNIMGGARYLRQMLDYYKGDTQTAVAAYNAGPGNVDKFLAGENLPDETSNYVPTVFRNMRGIAGGVMSPAEKKLTLEKLDKMKLEQDRQAARRETDRLYQELLAAGEGLPLDEAWDKFMKSATQIADHEIRQEVIIRGQQDRAAIKTARDAQDQRAIGVFEDMAKTKNLTPSEKIAMLDSMPANSGGFSQEGMEKYRKSLLDGTRNKETPENRAALAEFMDRVDNGELVDVEAFGFEHGFTNTQINKGEDYKKKGGMAGVLTKRAVDQAFKSFFSDKNKKGTWTGKWKIPADLYDHVLSQLKFRGISHSRGFEK
jgi:DNA-binding protein H-NS